MIAPALQGRFTGPAGEQLHGWWTVPVPVSGTVVPDGAIDVMWAPGRSPWLAGPDTRPHPVSLAAASMVVGVRLRPGLAPALLGAPATAAVDTLVPLADIWPAATVRRLDEELAAAGGPAEAARALADAVVAVAGPDRRPDPVVSAAVSRLERGDGTGGLGLGPRQLRRRFGAAMGYGPTFYGRITRLDRFTRLAAGAALGVPLAQLGAAAGYYDEAHLWRDCVALTGRTPAQHRPASGPAPAGR